MTTTIKVSVLDWDDVIDRTALGFDQVKPPGLAEVVALRRGRHRDRAGRRRAQPGPRRSPSAATRGPVVAVAGRFVQTSVHTTVGALLDGGPIAAQPCETEPITLPAGQQELLISPGAAFIVDGVQLAGAAGRRIAQRRNRLRVSTGAWGADHREVRLPPSPVARVLVVPESINPGWTARTARRVTLTPVAVNGWQQGWVVPAGTSGTVTLPFASNALYRAGLAGGLALLPVLAAARAAARARRPGPTRRCAVGTGPVGGRRGGGGRRADLRVVGAAVFAAAARTAVPAARRGPASTRPSPLGASPAG